MSKLLSSITALALLLSATPALAAEVSAGVTAKAEMGMQASEDARDNGSDNGSENGMMGTSSKMGDRGEGMMNQEGKDSAEASDTASSSEREHGQVTAEEHRSVVATFVHSLLSEADRAGGIGEEVRTVAQNQQQSASTTAEAMARIETRSRIATFLFGTDWNSAGTIRSELAKGNNDITKLQGLLASTTSSTVRATIEAQIQNLTQEQERVQAFVQEHENRFSLFGWFVKLFASSGN